MENEVFESAEEIVLTIDEVKDLVDDLEKDMLKSDEVDWEQTQKINESSKKIDDIISEIESIKEVLQNVQEQSEENELFNQDLMQKFDYSEEKAWTLARIVDTQGQVIIETASRSICEEHQLQVHNYGADHRITSSKGSMSAIIESST